MSGPGYKFHPRVHHVAYHAQLTAKKYKYYRPGLQDQEWGMREMTVQDGFGNSIIFYRDLPRG